MDKCSILLTLGLLVVASGAMAAVPSPKPAKPDMLVGAYYFPGWNPAEKWYCIDANDHVQHPLLGYYDESSPEAADWHIKWALEHGISFFAFDYYTANGSQMLETALDDGFLKAKHIGEFKFCLNWCNHADESTMTAEQLDKFGDLVVKKYLTHPSYLKIDDKPVVMFLVGQNFIRNMGLDAAKQAFGRLQAKAKAAGLPGVYLVFCHDAMGPNEIEACRSVGVDAFARYNYPYQGTGFTGPGKHGEFSYQFLTDQGEAMWKQWHGLTNGDYWPTVMAGWDRRPWTKDEDVIITGMTPRLFRDSLAKTRDYVSKDKVVMIEAWNEWGEGSILEPSVEHGFAYLDAVREVFCQKAGPHKDVDPKSLGLPQPAFDVKLPSTDVWRFDSDTDGWTAGGISNLRNDWGAIAGSSTTGDPTLTSPLTYIECRKYSKVRIRMMASIHAEKIPVGGPDVKTPTQTAGQFFWSTTQHIMSGAQSVTFPVQLDGQWHDYEIDLKSNPNWQGLTDRLRLDPADRAGVDFAVDEIKLVRA